ncbi:hypothetical protein [Streptomyces sp. NBC_00690]|uniref:hypothetical protein n=1 Tax=Streptomyces sp. NBC_00690 TaxID=2975808 RepID=UPI002E2AB321|nr:hypothetical protein [Streptomyces sp. NBC_00690]
MGSGLGLAGLRERPEWAGGTIADPARATTFVAARAAEGGGYRKIVIDEGSTAGTVAPTLGRGAAHVRHP